MNSHKHSAFSAEKFTFREIPEDPPTDAG